MNDSKVLLIFVSVIVLYVFLFVIGCIASVKISRYFQARRIKDSGMNIYVASRAAEYESEECGMKNVIKAVVLMVYALVAVLIVSAVISIVKTHAQETHLRSFTGYESSLKIQYPRMPGDWFKLIEKECGTDIPVSAMCALIDTESEWIQHATSPSGAMGPTQLMPGTARLLNITDPYDWRQNIRGGIRHFRLCMTRSNGDISKAFMKYHAGPARESFPRISEDYARKCIGKMRQTEIIMDSEYLVRQAAETVLSGEDRA